MTTRVINWFKFASPQAFYFLAGRLFPWFAALATVLLLVGLWVAFHFPNYLYSTELFNSHYFATSEFLQSLGDLGFTVLAVCLAIVVSGYYLTKF